MSDAYDLYVELATVLNKYDVTVPDAVKLEVMKTLREQLEKEGDFSKHMHPEMKNWEIKTPDATTKTERD